MTNRFLLSLPILTLCLLLAACQQQPSQTPVVEEAQEPEATATEAVEYEPAYPTDVSAEALSTEDVSQHEAAHSHEAEDHSHGDDEHSHEEGEAHDESDHPH